MADLFLRCCSKDYLMHAMQICMSMCVCIAHEFAGLVMIGSFWLCVFLGGGCIFCFYQQLLIHQHLFNCCEWEQCVYVMSV